MRLDAVAISLRYFLFGILLRVPLLLSILEWGGLRYRTLYTIQHVGQELFILHTKIRKKITIDTETCLSYNMAMFPENVERNKRLVKERKAKPKISWEQLGANYSISGTQAKRLYDAHKSKYAKKP